MIAGDLRHRVTVLRRPDPQTHNAFGEVITTWSEIATVWGAVEPQSGNETIEQGARVAQVTHVVRIRRRADVRPEMRITNRGRVYEVLTVLDANKPGEMRLICREVIT